jgi:mRNA interferase MazF
MTVNRGEVWMVDTPYGEKPYLIVSNQQRNRNLDSVLCARVTTSPRRPDITSIVPIQVRGQVVGSVLCDDIVQVEKSRLKRRRSNAFPPGEMARFCEGIAAAFGCGVGKTRV